MFTITVKVNLKLKVDKLFRGNVNVIEWSLMFDDCSVCVCSKLFDKLVHKGQ